MCGFFASNDPSISNDHYDKIKSRLSFRGPDFQSKLIKFKGWSLFHSRLSIIATPDTYNQPFSTPSGGMILFNGEILNYEDLSKKYCIANITSDTHLLSIIVEMPNFNPNDLEGFFSFVYIDNKGVLQKCMRDRFGVKPLSFYEKDKFISISSEASILSDIYHLDYSEEAINEYRVFRAPIFSESFFKGVRVVKPGTCHVSGKYFDSLDYVCENFGVFDELVEELEYKIKSSIKSRLVSDVPVGLLYSGGIDSNLIKSLSPVKFKSFTGGMENDYDTDHAKEIGDPNSKTHIIEKKLFLQKFKEMVKLRKEPLSVPNEVILSFLAEDWSMEGGKVLLSGEAADELFAGYDRIYFWALSQTKFETKEFLKHYAYLPLEQINDDIIEQTKDFFKKISFLSVFEQVRQFFIKIHLPILFRRLDFSLMYGGIEGREPLASTDLFVLSQMFKPKELFRESLGKMPLRKVMKIYSDENFAFRKKVGFPIDIKEITTGIKSNNRLDNYSSWVNLNLKEIR